MIMHACITIYSSYLTRLRYGWLMQFNVDKCKIMHCGHNNTLKQIMYTVELGILVQDNLKVSVTI